MLALWFRRCGWVKTKMSKSHNFPENKIVHRLILASFGQNENVAFKEFVLMCQFSYFNIAFMNTKGYKGE